MDSPYWGVFAQNTRVKERVAQRVSQQTIDTVFSLQNMLEKMVCRIKQF
jgi:hypothetical protein